MESHSMLLRRDNYAEWRAQMESDLIKRNLWSVVMSPEASGQEDVEVSSGDWEGKNSSALCLIRDSCGDEAKSKIRKCTSASDAWNILAEKFTMLITIRNILAKRFDLLDHISKDNFGDWAVRMKSYLIARNLWGAVDHWHEDGESYYDRLGKEKEALQEIRAFCGEEALSVIEDENKPDRAWEKLVQKYDMEIGIKADGENYADWRSWMESDLMFLQLWDIIESSTDPIDTKNDEVASVTWREKNSRALEEIRVFCGWRALFTIKDTSSAKRAWNILEEVYKEPVKRFVEAVKSGEREIAEKLLIHHPRLKTDKITSRGETALYIAVLVENEQSVELLLEQIESTHPLCTSDNRGFTALGLAIIRGKSLMVKCILRTKKELIGVQVANERIPVVLAIEYGNKVLAHYLYKRTPLKVLKKDKGIHGATVCTHAIYNGMLDIALDLIKQHPPLALAVDMDGCSTLHALASTPNAFSSDNQAVFWKRWIYFVCYHSFGGLFNCSENRIQSTSTTDDSHLSIRIGQIQTNESDGRVNIQSEQVQSNNSGFEDLEEEDSLYLARELLHSLCQQISISSDEDRTTGGVSSAVNLATREGMFEFIDEILKTNDAIKCSIDENGRTILANAVLHRQAKIYRHLLKSPEKNAMINSLDYDKNNLLHMTGMLPLPTQLDLITGAAKQMQYEVRWFKMVEKIVPAIMKKAKNKDGSTPKALFTKAHGVLRSEGEKWMKETATFGTVIVTLVIAVVFAASFTTPGSYNQATGLPILLNDKLFKVFMVCNSISLVSSSTSVLMFLAILTSRYAEEDFLRSLPVKMMIALSALLFSVAIMMTGFCSALVLVLHGQPAIFVPILCLVGFPVTLFILIQVRLIIEMSKSTYGLIV